MMRKNGDIYLDDDGVLHVSSHFAYAAKLVIDTNRRISSEWGRVTCRSGNDGILLSGASPGVIESLVQILSKHSRLGDEGRRDRRVRFG